MRVMFKADDIFQAMEANHVECTKDKRLILTSSAYYGKCVVIESDNRAMYQMLQLVQTGYTDLSDYPAVWAQVDIAEPSEYFGAEQDRDPYEQQEIVQ